MDSNSLRIQAFGNVLSLRYLRDVTVKLPRLQSEVQERNLGSDIYLEVNRT